MKKVIGILLAISTVLFFISCGSKPTNEDTKPTSPVVEDNKDDKLEDNVEDDNANDDADADAYEKMLSQISSARQLALDAGADKNATDELFKVDDYYNSFKDDEDALKKNGPAIIERYNLLTAFSKAKEAKKEIDDNDFASYSQKDYDSGVKSLEIAEAAFDDLENWNPSALSAATDANGKFTNVLIVAYKKLAKAERDLAYDAKKKADSVKAGVAQKERYQAATEAFKNGDTLYAMQSPKKSLENYRSAKEEFTFLFEDVSEKRAAAQAAIEEAKRKVAETERYALEADQRNPITEEINGIEDEDAVLLDEDNYENPEDAESDIAPTIEEEIANEIIDYVSDLRGEED